MYDILPESSWMWQKLEKHVSETFSSYGFKEIRFPIVEKTELFTTAIGQATDVVEKEMYTFESRSGSSLSLRPEGTAGCVRAVIQNELCNRGLTQKLWYQGPMFRYERPQKGRNRQFTQIGAEVFGYPQSEAEAELILMSAQLWKLLGIPNLRLEINSLGTSQARKEYRNVLINYFEQHLEVLDDDAKNRLHQNPLRILDSKNPKMKEIVQNAPALADFLDEDSKEHFRKVQKILDACGIEYIINPKLVRGLDYYSKTVFEWVTDDLGAQGTICAGGRYDSLVEIQGGKPTAGVGFAMGLDRIIELVKDLNLWQKPADCDVFLIVDKSIKSDMIFEIIQNARKELPDLTIQQNFNPGSFKSQFKKADKSGAKIALIIGEDEIASNLVTVKSLVDKDFGQKQLSYAEFYSLMRSE